MGVWTILGLMIVAVSIYFARATDSVLFVIPAVCGGTMFGSGVALRMANRWWGP